MYDVLILFKWLNAKKLYRRKSGSSDNDDTIRKHTKRAGQLNHSVSDAISVANTVLYESPQSTSDVNLPTNMASSCPADTGLKDIKEELILVLSTIKDIKSNQESMTRNKTRWKMSLWLY